MHQPDVSSQKGAWVLVTVINASWMYYNCRVRCINMTRTCVISRESWPGDIQCQMIQHGPRELTALANLVFKTTLEVQMSGSRLRKFMRLCGPRVEGHYLLCGGAIVGSPGLEQVHRNLSQLDTLHP